MIVSMVTFRKESIDAHPSHIVIFEQSVDLGNKLRENEIVLSIIIEKYHCQTNK